MDAHIFVNGGVAYVVLNYQGDTLYIKCKSEQHALELLNALHKCAGIEIKS